MNKAKAVVVGVVTALLTVFVALLALGNRVGPIEMAIIFAVAIALGVFISRRVSQARS